MPNGSVIQALRPGFRLQSKERSYEIVKVLGSGSFGITYLATSQVSIGNISTTMRFAIKEHFLSASCYRGEDGSTVLAVPTAKSDVVDSLADFITEANRLQKLCLMSRNIVSVNETFESNGTAYYVMEYLDGGNPSRCSEDNAVSIVLQIADALNVIHKERVLHLDIKPDNIVLKKNAKNETYPVLIDFGISKHFDSKNRPTSSLGAKGASPGFAPQEQYAGISEFSPKYDIYALGAVLFFLCTGKNPPDAFKISPNQQELKQSLGMVSSRVEKAILNAMKPNASERTASIKEFCDDLRGIDFIPRLNTPYSQLEFSKEKGQKSMPIDSNINWTAYAENDWCIVKKKDGEIVVSVTKNKETASRICQVVVTGVSYQLSQIIHIQQDGVGTVVLSPQPTWWKIHRKLLYQVGYTFLAGCCVFGIWVINKPNPLKESMRLTDAIATLDGTTLEEFIKNDSARAYYPYAQILFKEGKLEDAAFCATIAMGTSDSIAAKELLQIVHATIEASSIMEDTKEETAELAVSDTLQENMPAILVDEHTEDLPIETNDEKFARAKNDFNLMLALANDKYVKAYYPLAKMFFDKKDRNNAQLWAQRAIKAKTNSKEAKLLLNKITDIINDELFAKANSIDDFKNLAIQKYLKAYAPLSELYLKKHDYDSAHLWAVKAVKSRVDLDKARRVVEILDSYGYYDNGEHGGKPSF